jgi:hypothetical protein
MSDQGSPQRQEHNGEGTRTLSTAVDWLVAGVLVLAGLLAALVGVGLNTTVDRAELARLVADGTIESGVLSDAELVDVAYALAWWGGLGVAVMGLLFVGGAVAFLFYRRRTRRRRAERGITSPDTATNAIVGAVVTVVTSFVPFSPVLGGAVAGYLEGGERMGGARAGGLSGLVASLPVVVLFVFLVGSLFVVSAQVSVGIGAGVVALLAAVALAIAVLYTVVLSALGGYIGVYVGERRSTGSDDYPPSG